MRIHSDRLSRELVAPANPNLGFQDSPKIPFVRGKRLSFTQAIGWQFWTKMLFARDKRDRSGFEVHKKIILRHRFRKHPANSASKYIILWSFSHLNTIYGTHSD